MRVCFSVFFVVVVCGCNEILPPPLFMQIHKQINLEHNKKNSEIRSTVCLDKYTFFSEGEKQFRFSTRPE